MEVADQWRREWAGTAEYGKVTEGGITRRVARAMEVLHASGPGARVRVMRAAYHSTAGPGIPSSSYMLHSSRRILSSGFNLEEPPSLPSKPLEISSVPLELSPDRIPETENYKVTEPDDIDISEPSKWKGSTRTSGIRMPSEESSSTDNASIIDLNSKSSSRNLHRKYSYDSENSDIHWNKRNSSRMSPLLDSPVTLSTLKYKSLLNNSSEWNTRRKSYSFEDTSPIIESPFHNETLAMESSTDSGICKSSEIVNDQVDENMNYRYVEKKEKNTGLRDESFQDWLSKNRTNSFYRGTTFKSQREHEIVIEDPVENNISLQATGKVSITLPITVEKGYEGPVKKSQSNDESQRKVKKVEFCKTELHFAADSGKVNIIATDEKPPPSNDFRKRRSLFLPIQNMSEKPITLFGDKTKEYPEVNHPDEIFMSESGELDENTAATKSILKNKIPKPKPYLLGENMVLGLKDNVKGNERLNDFSVATAVSLINKQLDADQLYTKEKTSVFSREIHPRQNVTPTLRTVNQGPIVRNDQKETGESDTCDSIDSDMMNIREKIISKKNFQGSSPQSSLKTRQLRESDMTYFGVKNGSSEVKSQSIIKNRLFTTNTIGDNIFQSVKLIQQISQSVSNSEPESEDSPEYQNLPLNTCFTPIPTPRHCLKYDDQPNEIEEINVSKPTVTREKIYSNENIKRPYRRTKSREHYETASMGRSRSEPRKSYSNSLNKSQQIKSTRCTKNHGIEKKQAEETVTKLNSMETSNVNNLKGLVEDEVPLYVNLNSDTGTVDNTMIKRQITKKSLDPQKDSNSKDEIKKSDLKPGLNIPNTTSIKKSPVKAHIRQGIDNVILSTRDLNEHRRGGGTTQKDKKDDKNLKNKNRKAGDLMAQIEDVKQYAKQSMTRNINTIKQEHRSRSSHRRISSNEMNTRATKSKDTSDKSLLKDTDLEAKRRASPEKRTPTKEPVKIRDRKSDTDSPVRRVASGQYKPTEKNVLSKSITKTVNSHTPKRNEYVINYDDKNGTMSSMCQLKPGSHSSRRKVVLDKAKDNAKENKYYLLQLDHHQEDLNRSKHTDRKWKTKVLVHRSCQLL